MRGRFDNLALDHLGFVGTAYLVGGLKTLQTVQAVAAEQFDQFGARGVEHAQSAQLLKSFLIGVEGPVCDLDKLLTLLRVGAIEQHGHKLCVRRMVRIANASMNRGDRLGGAGSQ